MRRGHAQTVGLERRVFARLARAAAEDFAQDARLLETERVHTRVDCVGRQLVEHKIRGRVVAHDDHQMERVAQGQTQAVVKLEEDA